MVAEPGEQARNAGYRDEQHKEPESGPDKDGAVDMRVTTKKALGFYIRNAKNFITGFEDKVKVWSIISKMRNAQRSVDSFQNDLQKVTKQLASMMKQIEQVKLDLRETQDLLESTNIQVCDVRSGRELTQERLQQHTEEQIVPLLPSATRSVICAYL